MKKIIIAVLLALSTVAAVAVYRFIWPDMTPLQQADLSGCEVVLYQQNGAQVQRKPLQLNAEEDEQLRAWLLSLGDMRVGLVNYVSYVPGLFLCGKDFQFEFLGTHLRASFGPDFTYQVCRPLCPADICTAELLRRKLEETPQGTTQP